MVHQYTRHATTLPSSPREFGATIGRYPERHFYEAIELGISPAPKSSSTRGVNKFDPLRLSSTQDVRKELKNSPTADRAIRRPSADKKLTRLKDILELISDRSPLDHILEQIVSAAYESLGVDEMTLFLLDHSSNQLVLQSSKRLGEPGESPLRIQLDDTQSFLSRAFVRGDATLKKSTVFYAPGRDAESVLSIPLVFGDMKLGLLCACQLQPNSMLSPADESWLTILAASAATAIELRDRTSDFDLTSNALTRLHDLNAAFLSDHHLTDYLTNIAETARVFTRADSVVIYQYLLEEDDVLVPPIVAGMLRQPEVLAAKSKAVRHKSSVVFKLLKQSEPFYAPNALQDWARHGFFDIDADRNFLAREGIESSVGVPLEVEGAPIGVIFVNYTTAQYFSPRLKDRIEFFAAQTALAINNATLLSKSHKYTANLRALQHLGAALRSARLFSARSIAELLYETSAKLMSVSNFYLCLYDESTNSYSLVFMDDEKDSGKDFKSEDFQRGFSDYVRRNRTPLLATRQVQDEITARGEAEIVGSRSAVWLGVPLIAGDRVLGVIAIQNYEDERAYSQEHLDLMSTIASQAAVAIEHSLMSSFSTALVEGGPDPIVAVNDVGAVTEFNKAAEHLFGMPRELALKKTVAELYWEGLSEAKRIGMKLKVGDNIDSEETFIRSATSEKIPVDLSAALLWDAERAMRLGSVGILKDSRLSALRGRSRSLLNAINRINRSEELNAALEVALLETLALIGVNAGAIFLQKGGRFMMRAEIGLEEAGGMASDEVFSEETLVRVASEEQTIEVNLHTPGQHSWGLLVPLMDEAKVVGILAILGREPGAIAAPRDHLDILASQIGLVINRLQLVEERDRTQQHMVRTANTLAIAQVASGFVHEVKNALNSMVLTISNVARDVESDATIPDKRKARYVRRLGSVEDEVARLDGLARRLNQLSRQGLKPELSEVFLNDVVESTLDLMRSALKSANVKHTTNLDPSLSSRAAKGAGRAILADDRQLQQVVINLILNAVAASPPRARIEIETEVFPEEVVVRVRDFGRGITPEQRKRIFDAFFTTREDGTGLGLYVAKLIVEDLHNGRIEVASTPGKGALFEVFLPRNLA